jgi:hypothetical protein
MNTKNETLDSLRVFLNKLQRLIINKVDSTPFNQNFDQLFDRIVENKQTTVEIDIDDDTYEVVIILEDGAAFVVYDYHEIFNEIAQEIRNIDS